MAMNSKGEFIIADGVILKVKVFDRRGQFMHHVSLPDHNVDQESFLVVDVAVDMNDNFYVLVKLFKLHYSGSEFVVSMFNNNGEMHHQFPVKVEVHVNNSPAMIVDSKRKVVIKGNRHLKESSVVDDDVENDGQFVRSFGEGLLRCSVNDLALASDDRVIVLDGDSYVHMFSEHGDHLSKFKHTLGSALPYKRTIAFHHSSEHLVLADVGLLYVYLHIYTKDGELVRSTKIYVEGIGESLRRMIVTAEGHVALLNTPELFTRPRNVFIVC